MVSGEQVGSGLLAGKYRREFEHAERGERLLQFRTELAATFNLRYGIAVVKTIGAAMAGQTQGVGIIGDMRLYPSIF